MHVDDQDYLAHIGVIRRSGRYPWGSGGDDMPQNSATFLQIMKDLLKNGFTRKQVADHFGMTTHELNAARSIAIAEERASKICQAIRLQDKGLGASAIGREMGVNESVVRTWLKPGALEKATIITTIANKLRDRIDEVGYLDVGKGLENNLGVSADKLRSALEIIKLEGYVVESGFKVPQPTPGQFTKMKVAAAPENTWGDIARAVRAGEVKQMQDYSEDGGRSWFGILDPKVLDPRRVAINYAEDGGASMDGVMFVRPGVEDVSLGGNRYAQIRAKVGDSLYLKGMAVYKDDLPKGIDVMFNTNKTRAEAPDISDVLKPLSDDKDNPFGSVISRQIVRKNDKGEDELTSVMNLVNEEGTWQGWSRRLSAQVLSKQEPQLIKERLAVQQAKFDQEFEEIMSMTNPTVRRKLLEQFSEKVDAYAVNLHAATLPRSAWHVILPENSLKPNEIYAPNYKDGERVALIRYPHGGTFEIPQLVVNNKNRNARKLLGDVGDAVAINSKVADQLSGADFDGDTVLVIPNNSRKINSTKPLEGLKGFDPRRAFPPAPGVKVLRNTQKEMGDISNLITDMTLMGASAAELTRAVKHSMVVIDAESKKLNYRESAKVHGIKALKDKYQLQPDGSQGAATIISRAKGRADIPERKPRGSKQGGPINTKTGELEYEPTGRTHWKTGELVTRTHKRLAVTKDANEISSGLRVEEFYADHSNKLKALANESRLAQINTPRSAKKAGARKVYEKEVGELEAVVDLAARRKPYERQALQITDARVKAKKQEYPNMSKAMEKKVRSQALTQARQSTITALPPELRSRAKHVITPRQWEAIQAGAFSDTALRDILNASDMDVVKQLATPKPKVLMPSSKITRAKAMISNGATRAEVAEVLGVSVSTLDRSLGD